MEERFVLTKSELLELLRDRYVLSCLEDADVYNWSSYENADDADSFPTDEEIARKAKQMLKNYENYY